MSPPRSRPAWLLVIVVVALTTALAGCSDDGDDAAPEAPAPEAPAAAPAPATTATATVTAPATAPPAASEVVVYFGDDAGDLVAERRDVAEATLVTAMGELAAGPEGADLFPALPAGSGPPEARVERGVATVELPLAFVDEYPSGSAAEIATLAPIVYTATALPGIDAVLLRVGGAPPDPPGAQFDLAGALRRADLPVTVRDARGAG